MNASIREGEFSEDAALKLPGFLKDPGGLLRRRWKWMLLVLLLGLGATGLLVRNLAPSYVGRATVLVTSQRISEEFFRSTVESDQLEKISAIVGELLSRQNLVHLIEKHALYPSPEGVEPMPMEDKVALLRANTEIKPDLTNGSYRPGSSAVVYAISYRSENRWSAANVANELAAEFIDTHLRMRSRQARLTTEFLRRELKQVEEDLAKQERAITEFKQAHRGELPGELQTNLARLDRLQAQRQSLALQIAEAETRLATLSATAQPGSSPAQRLAELRARYEEQQAIYTPEHPNVVAIGRQIEALEKELARSSDADSPTSAVAGVSTIEELRRQLAATVAEFEDLDQRVARTPRRQEELAALEQRAEILRESHREFLRKVSQAELAEAVESAQQGERATILDKAVPPNKPDNSPTKYIAVGIIGSIGLALFAGILLEFVDAVIVDASEVEQAFHLPVLGSVPRMQ
ncbi:MAG TPA: hypothetical protein ENI85_02340 [Deltaproteobacteria bacterium]|nr:hypothetical protein [Deltaproteobacteria bacterium]